MSKSKVYPVVETPFGRGIVVNTCRGDDDKCRLNVRMFADGNCNAFAGNTRRRRASSTPCIGRIGYEEGGGGDSFARRVVVNETFATPRRFNERGYVDLSPESEQG